jgi:hypothetical protein
MSGSGVVRGRIRRAVPQHGTDHVERGTAPQHGRRRRMSQQTRALHRGIDPCEVCLVSATMTSRTRWASQLCGLTQVQAAAASPCGHVDQSSVR